MGEVSRSTLCLVGRS